MTASVSNVTYLCICVDDFGMSEGINAAVFELVERSRISATSCMVGRGAWAAGLPGLREIDPLRIDVGLHLDFSRSVHGDAPESSLARFIARSYLGMLRPAPVLAEIRDQLARFEDGLGRAPAFVDGHRHVHQLPIVRDMLVEELADRYRSSAPWLRSTAPPPTTGIAKTKADLIHALGGRALCRLAARRGIPTSLGLLGVYDFAGDTAAYRLRLERWVGACRTGDVLMCHPSLTNLPSDPIGAARVREFDVLSAIGLPLRTEHGAVALMPLSGVLRSSSLPRP